MSDKAVGAGSSGPPAVCLLHLNLEPCPWCAQIKELGVAARPAGLTSSEAEPAETKAETLVERARELFGGIEAAVIDTAPRRRRPRS